jgi:hypothetical protein
MDGADPRTIASIGEPEVNVYRERFARAFEFLVARSAMRPGIEEVV